LALRNIAVVVPAKNQLLRDFSASFNFRLLQHYPLMNGHARRPMQRQRRAQEEKRHASLTSEVATFRIGKVCQFGVNLNETFAAKVRPNFSSRTALEGTFACRSSENRGSVEGPHLRHRDPRHIGDDPVTRAS